MIKKLVLSSAALLAIGILALVPKAINHAGAVGNNLIANPGVETSVNNLPTGWSNIKTGTNTTAFNYLNTGHTGSHSLQVLMTKRSSGQAEWYFKPVAIVPNTKYTFSDWYQSNVASTFAVIVTKTTGVTSTLTTVNEAASPAWKQATLSFTTPAKASTLTIRQYINKVGQVTTDDYDLEGPAVVAPTVSVSAPAANASVAGTQTVSATATGGSSTVKNVQFKLDGVNLGTADTTSPYSVSWNTTGVANGTHTLSAVVTTASNITASSANVSVAVNNPTAPTVSISSPSTNATVSATQAVTASASDAQGITSVQFKLDNANLGSPVTTTPYNYNWDTTTATNGTHSLTAVATNKANLSTTSAAMAVTVQNQAAINPGNGPNIILNPSVETSTSGTVPDNWLSSNWGTNTSTFSYLNTGHTGNHSLEVQTTAWTNGSANWYYADLPVTAGTTYQYSNWYQSNVNTEVDAEVTMSDGTISYYYLGTVLANTTWSQFSTTFTVPAGAKTMAVYQILAKVGYIISDDYSLNTYTPKTFNRGIVTINFDDGWLDQYINGVPALQANGNLPATFFIITDSSITNPDPEYMNTSQIITLKNDGYEIGNHTETHPDLTTLTAAQVQTEMAGAEAALQSAIGVTATDFAYPYGAYNASTVAIGQQVGFVSQRSVNSGFNTKDSIDFTQLKIEEVDANISPAQVQAWVNQAVAQHTWLILVYHEIDTVAPAGSGDTAYMTSPTNLYNELAYIHSTGVAVETTAQAINEIKPQL